MIKAIVLDLKSFCFEKRNEIIHNLTLNKAKSKRKFANFLKKFQNFYESSEKSAFKAY